MKKQYTRKQIVEAISYWKKQLKLMNEETEDDLMGIIDGYADSRDAAEQRQTNSKLDKFLQNCKSILEQCPKLQRIRPIVMKLFERNLVRYCDTGKRFGDLGKYSFHYCYNQFTTDGWFHEPGFSSKRDAKAMFGCEGGGASGNSVYVDIDNGLFGVTKNEMMPADEFAEQTTSRGKPYYLDYDIASKVQEIADGIDSYVKMVEDYVRSLRK